MAAEPTIRYQDRIFLTGATGSGKSTLALRLFLSSSGQAPRMILDPVGSDLTDVAGAVTFSDVRTATNRAGENWRQAATARFVPDDPDDLDAYSAVYSWIYNQQRPRYVWCDEAGLILPVQRRNPGGRKVLIAGRKLGIGHLACHTRPRFVDTDVVVQAQHVFVFVTPGANDRKYLADGMGVDLATFEAAHAQLAEHGFLHWDQRARALTILDPL